MLYSVANRLINVQASELSANGIKVRDDNTNIDGEITSDLFVGQSSDCEDEALTLSTAQRHPNRSRS